MDAATRFLNFIRDAPAGLMFTGMQYAAPEVQAQRLAVCKTCPNNREGKCVSVEIDGRVQHGCGCDLQTRAGNPLPVCPQNKWPT